jgi:hypothetical protein
MPGPKMGPRPSDFNENLIRQSPTFMKWNTLAPGTRLRYACREFIKGHSDDEERLMRRIMIARRNNIRDHETLKAARHRSTTPTEPVKTEIPSEPPTDGMEGVASTLEERTHVCKVEEMDAMTPDVQPTIEVPATTTTTTNTNITTTRTRRPPHTFSDSQVEKEMDVSAVERTRSYRSWMDLSDGSEFVVRFFVLMFFFHFGNFF